jgi:hypothetical protein
MPSSPKSPDLLPGDPFWYAELTPEEREDARREEAECYDPTLIPEGWSVTTPGPSEDVEATDAIEPEEP